MTHVNPYTGLRWCDDPAVAIFKEAPELTIFQLPTIDKWPINGVEPYASELKARFIAWAKEEKDVDISDKDINLDAKDDRLLREFYVKLESNYYKEITEALRADGVKIPLVYDAPMFFKSRFK